MDPLSPEFTHNLVRKTERILDGMDRVMRPGGIATPEGLSPAVRAGMQHLAAHKGDVRAALAAAKATGAGWRDPVPEVGVPADMAMVSRTAPHINIEADLAGSLTPLTSDVRSGDFGQGGETSRLMPSVQTAGAEEEEEPGDEELDQVRAQEFSETQAQIAQLDPASPYAASISAPGWVFTQNDLYQIEGALDEKIDEIASEIASGHASGGATDYAFEAMINATIRNSSKSGTLRRGRSYYYDQPNNFVVIVDPNGADSGTAFHPATGSSYLKTLE
jgi:hypothetical protein